MDIITQPKRRQSRVGINADVGTGYVVRFSRSSNDIPQTQHGSQFTIAVRPSIAVSRSKYHYRSCGPARAFCLDYRGAFDKGRLGLDLGTSVAVYGNSDPLNNRPRWSVQPFAGMTYVRMLHTMLGATAGAGYSMDITRHDGSTTLLHGPYLKLGLQMPLASRLKSLMRDRFYMPSLKLGTKVNLLLDKNNRLSGWQLSLALTLVL